MWQRRWNIIVVRWRCLLTWTEALHLAGLASEFALPLTGTRTYLCAGTRTRSPGQEGVSLTEERCTCSRNVSVSSSEPPGR